MRDAIQHSTTGNRVGLLQVKVGTYWMFFDAKKENEDDDMTVIRIINERNFYKAWTYILSIALSISTVLTMVFAP